MIDEHKAAKVLAEMADRRSFAPRVFGLSVINDHPTQCQNVMAAFIGFVDMLADRKDVAPANTRQAAILAYNIREEMTLLYGEWPPPLDEF